MQNFKTLATLLIGVLANGTLYANSAPEKSKYGISVEWCNADYDNVDFCSDKKMKAYANILKTRKPNFDKDKILYIFEEDKKLMDMPESYIDKYYRVVVINPKTKLVTPASFGITEARDSSGKLIRINDKGESLKFDFNINSNKFCFSGNWDEYRRGAAYYDKPYCAKYDNSERTFYFQYD